MSDTMLDRPICHTRAVVQRTCVPATTFRGWERRYGFPRPQRDASGRRLYTERDVQTIRWLLQQVENGVAPARAIGWLDAGEAGPPSGPSPRIVAPRSLASLQQELTAAVLALDTVAGEAVLGDAFALYSIEDVCLGVLQPLLVDIGARWIADEVLIAEEHFASSFIRARVSALLLTLQRGVQGAPLIVAACAPGEWHELGVLLVCVFLARRGFVVRYLGPNLPIQTLPALVARHRPAMVVLSAQSHGRAKALGKAAQALREGPPPHPVLGVGGQALNLDPGLRTLLDATYLGPDAASAAAVVSDLFGCPGRRFGRRARSRRGGN
jgi:MerR family transcriptional regulator, light-induced transcriptional regulator